MASKYFYWITWTDGEVKPGFFPIDDEGRYYSSLGVHDLRGQNLALAREVAKRKGGDAEDGRILRFNRKTLEFVGVVK
ncbi:hypothetical protein [Pseudomonas phage PP21]